MSERYTRLYKLPSKLYAEGAPVLIAAGALLKDNENGTVLAQLKLQNTGDKTVKSVTVRVEQLDGNGNTIGDETEYIYSGISAQKDACFGDREPVILDNAETKQFTVYLAEVVFDDDSVWPYDMTETPDNYIDEDYLPPLDDAEDYETEEGEASETQPGAATDPEAGEEDISWAEEVAAENSTAQSAAGKKSGKKNSWIIYVVLAAVIIIVALVVCSVQLGWFGGSSETAAESADSSVSDDSIASDTAVSSSADEMTMDDYTTIEIAQSEMDDVNDDLVQEYIDSMLSSYTTTENVTEGTVAENDTIYISYIGYLDGEAFDGGTSEGTSITVGSSGYIDGFDDGLIGAEIGTTVDLNLTFPDDYSSEDLAGQDVVFSVTIEYRIDTITPEFDDDFAAEYSLEYWGEQLDTADDLYNYIYDYLYDSYLYSAILSALLEKQTIITYNEENYNLLYEYAYEELAYYASYYGTDEDTFATYYGYEDADAYATDEAVYYDNLIILLNYLWEDLGFEELTDEETDAALEDYMEEYGYSSYYTLDEFKEACGEAWLLIFDSYELKYDTLMETLAERVVFTEE